jgi:hypothetical protein
MKKKRKERNLPLKEKDFKNSSEFFLDLSMESLSFLGCHVMKKKEREKRRERGYIKNKGLN